MDSLILVNPPAAVNGRSYYQKLSDQWGAPSLYTWPFEHLGLMGMLAAAQSRGLPAYAVDGMVLRHASITETFQAIQTQANVSGTPSLIAISVMIRADEAIELAGMCKKRWNEVKIVLGNNHASLNARYLLEREDIIDFVIVGDGEVAFGALGEAVLNRASIEGIPGLAYRRDGKICVNPSHYGPLDDLPWVSRQDLPFVQALGMSASIYSKRGCPFRCSFCGTGAVASLAGSAGFRERSPALVAEEIDMLVRDHRIEHLTIVDDLFLSTARPSKAWALEFADVMIRKRIRVPIMVDARVDSIDREIFTRLHEAGLRKVFVGIESASPDVLANVFNKSVSHNAVVSEKLRILEDIGIGVVPGMILFHAETTATELRANHELIRTVGYKNPHLFRRLLDAYPGTPIHKEYLDKGYISERLETKWHFKDPLAELMYRRLSQETSATGIDFEQVERAYLRELDMWDARIPPYDRPVEVLAPD